MQVLVPMSATAPTSSVSAAPPNPINVNPTLYTGTLIINKSINLLLRGKNSSNTLEIAKARRQRNIVQRDYCCC